MEQHLRHFATSFQTTWQSVSQSVSHTIERDKRPFIMQRTVGRSDPNCERTGIAFTKQIATLPQYFNFLKEEYRGTPYQCLNMHDVYRYA